MRLLVSVAHADEVEAALAGGADIVDAKDPLRGALGAVSPSVLGAIARALGGRRPLSVALGDASESASLDGRVARAGAAAATYVKIGFMGIHDVRQVRSLAAAAIAGAGDSIGSPRVILVTYADRAGDDCVGVEEIIDASADVGAAGVLLDTAGKDAGTLWSFLSADAVAGWIERAHRAGLLAAVAGSLDVAGIRVVARLGADVAGVRGAACIGGRAGRLSAARVATLAACAREADSHRSTGAAFSASAAREKSPSELSS